MTPDIRFYLRMTRATDDASETINVNTDNLRKKATDPNTIVWEEELTVFTDFGNTSHALKNGLSTHHYDLIATKLRRLTPHSELVIRGHGDVKLNRCCSVGGTALANFLLEAGLKTSCRVNITGCALGRNSQVPIASLAGEQDAAAVGTHSFAHDLQQALWKYGTLTPAVHARTVNVTITEEGRKETRTFASEGGPAAYESHQPHSKIIFRIDDSGTQYMVWAY